MVAASSLGIDVVEDASRRLRLAEPVAESGSCARRSRTTGSVLRVKHLVQPVEGAGVEERARP